MREEDLELNCGKPVLRNKQQRSWGYQWVGKDNQEARAGRSIPVHPIAHNEHTTDQHRFYNLIFRRLSLSFLLVPFWRTVILNARLWKVVNAMLATPDWAGRGAHWVFLSKWTDHINVLDTLLISFVGQGWRWGACSSGRVVGRVRRQSHQGRVGDRGGKGEVEVQDDFTL